MCLSRRICVSNDNRFARYTNLANRFSYHPALTAKYLNFSQLYNNLLIYLSYFLHLPLESFYCIFSNSKTTYILRNKIKTKLETNSNR